ncbi:CRISPR-associated endonuclease Cas2 [Marininema halotolerans]|uniref:CRISPR-associated endonuclease Cas2 n=1 Tax=Marininema halotolerans TaxID=1155944 RepID=UPI003CCBCE3B
MVSYDIENDRRRSKVFKLLKDHGQWIQYSLFEVNCDDTEWIQLEFQLRDLIDSLDSLCIYVICSSCNKKTFYTGELRYRLEEDKNNIL